jgi:hypothetical protein
MLSILLSLVILGALLYLVETFVPMSRPFRVAVRVVVVVIVVWYLARLVALVAPPFPRWKEIPMPSVPVVLTGVLTFSTADTPPGVNVPGFPTHPIAPGGQPPSVWPGPGTPTPPIFLPPGVNVPGFPTNPIAPGGQPPSVWPGQGTPTQPISGGGYVIGWSPVYGYVFLPIGGATAPGDGGTPTNPIAPGGEKPTHPIAPGGQPGTPTNPIAPTPQPK